MKKVLKMSILAAACIALLVLCGCSKKKSGEAGDNAKWTLEKGVLTVSGSGSVDEIKGDIKADEVSNIIIGDGIETIGDGVFNGFTKVTDVKLPDSLVNIGKKSFAECKALKELAIPDGVEFIDVTAFDGWDETQKIISSWYEGSVSEWNDWYEFWKNYFHKLGAIVANEDVKKSIDDFMAKWKDTIEAKKEGAMKKLEGFDGNMLSLVDIISRLPDGFIEDFKALVEKITEAYNSAKTMTEEEYDKIKDGWWDFWSETKKEIPDFTEKFGELHDKAKDFIKDKPLDDYSGVAQAFGFGDIVDMFKDFIND